MRIAFFDTHNFERPTFSEQLAKSGDRHQITFLAPRLTADTALLARNHGCVCSFVNDALDHDTIAVLASLGVSLIALRSAGYNNVDLDGCKAAGISVARVPAYSPHAVAEHAAGLILALNRKIPRAYSRVRDHNFSLDGLVGFDLNGKTVGVIGTGLIGRTFIKIMSGFGCSIIAYDPVESPELCTQYGVSYAPLSELCRRADIISLHCPLTAATGHLINSRSIAAMKRGVMLINTGRGALIETSALLDGLKSGQIGAAGLDVYEEEEGIFFHDLSDSILEDDNLARLLSYPNVIVTAHQGFLTTEALSTIAAVTLKNVTDFEEGRTTENFILAERRNRSCSLLYP